MWVGVLKGPARRVGGGEVVEQSREAEMKSKKK